MRIPLLAVLALAVTPFATQAQAPVFKIDKAGSSVKFSVKASVAIDGTFQKWDANMLFTSAKLSSAVLDIKIDASSIDTGSGMKDDKLKGKDFFDVKDDPYITFHSTKMVSTGANTFEVDGNFTIRGVSKPEKLTFTIEGAGTGTGSITGTMTFNRKDYGMTKGIPFVKIADSVEVTVDIKATRTSGPVVDLKN
jgi:polyisoprenoid-binding protein YceI